MITTGYTLSRTTSEPFAAAVERVWAELASAGFGVLCEIDVNCTASAVVPIGAPRPWAPLTVSLEWA
jgi:uncharacterized protein (DUF302 family)